MKKILECVPNFSEGRNRENIAKIVAPFKGKTDLRLLDTQRDEDHNRLVVTVIGEPEALAAEVLAQRELVEHELDVEGRRQSVFDRLQLLRGEALGLERGVVDRW